MQEGGLFSLVLLCQYNGGFVMGLIDKINVSSLIKNTAVFFKM